ncbi:MAG: hypothetical protein Q8P12_02635 [bacterium]|nr:hypothetical protein [bacterium]MDZ4345152.1 hypothetical protein [Candidatus Binatia bacterium]
MEIKRRTDIEQWLMDEMKRSFAEDERKLADPIHLSDLLNPRYAYWQRAFPMPLSDDSVQYFVAGRGHEDAIGRLSGVQRGGSRTESGIVFSCDFYTSIPIEFKTRRRLLAEDGKEAEVYDIYIEQARGYAALVDQPAAWLWVMSLVERQDDGSTKPETRCYLLEFTKEELIAERGRLAERRHLLLSALEAHRNAASNRDVFMRRLPLCWAFKCGKISRTMEEKPFCYTCNKVFETESGGKKHPDSKAGAGHEVRQGVIRYDYLPKCEWYHNCQPWREDPERGERK